MQHDHGLKVALPPTQRSSVNDSKRESRKQPLVGSSSNNMHQLWVSQQPREFHLYLGNLDVAITEDDLKEYIGQNNNAVRVLSCEIVRIARPGTLRAVAAHVSHQCAGQSQSIRSADLASRCDYPCVEVTQESTLQTAMQRMGRMGLVTNASYT